jgi:hypothetical protein
MSSRTAGAFGAWRRWYLVRYRKTGGYAAAGLAAVRLSPATYSDQREDLS